MFPQDARQLIPQKEPFVMIDELIYADDTTAKSRFEVKAANPFCSNGLFQEGGLLENIAQTAAAHSGFITLNNGSLVKKGFIGSVNNFEVVELPKQDDVLLTEINIIDQVFDVTVVSGVVYRDDIKIASAELKIFIVEQ